MIFWLAVGVVLIRLAWEVTFLIKWHLQRNKSEIIMQNGKPVVIPRPRKQRQVNTNYLETIDPSTFDAFIQGQ